MRARWLIPLTVVIASALSFAQLDKIVIPAGTPEDQALAAITSEQDNSKKVTMYEDFLTKFAGNSQAVAYGNWQVSQAYQNSGDMQKALEYGDKALAKAPTNLDILVSQTNIAQQLKDPAKVLNYAVKGGEAYNSIDKQPKPDGVDDAQWASRISDARESSKNSYQFLETGAFNVIADEKDAKTRMSYIERFSTAFPKSQFEEQITQYAMFTLGQLNDSTRLYSYGEKALAANPNSMPTLLLLANAYVEDSRAGSVTKAVTYSQKVVELAKANAPDADRSRKLSAGVAHSTLGYAFMKQDKTAAAVPALKTAAGLLKGQDDTAYATALYRLGYAYAKLNRVAEAKSVLGEAVGIAGPLQKPSQELLEKVNAAKARAK